MTPPRAPSIISFRNVALLRIVSTPAAQVFDQLVRAMTGDFDTGVAHANRRTTEVEANNGQSEVHRFQYRLATRVVQTGKDEDVVREAELEHRPMGHVAAEIYMLRYGQVGRKCFEMLEFWPGSDHGETGLSPSGDQIRQCLDRKPAALPGDKATDEEKPGFLAMFGWCGQINLFVEIAQSQADSRIDFSLAGRVSGQHRFRFTAGGENLLMPQRRYGELWVSTAPSNCWYLELARQPQSEGPG